MCSCVKLRSKPLSFALPHGAELVMARVPGVVMRGCIFFTQIINVASDYDSAHVVVRGGVLDLSPPLLARVLQLLERRHVRLTCRLGFGNGWRVIGVHHLLR